MNVIECTPAEVLARVRPGSRVTFFAPNGLNTSQGARPGSLRWKRRAGKCVIAPGRNQEHAVLKVGKRLTPAVADHENTLSVAIGGNEWSAENWYRYHEDPRIRERLGEEICEVL